MELEAFPEIENFQKLPRQVILKAGRISFDKTQGAKLHGLIINNCGHAICDVRANIVIFNEKQIPIYNLGVPTDPERLPQGAMGSFVFDLADVRDSIRDYHLYTNWSFDNVD